MSTDNKDAVRVAFDAWFSDPAKGYVHNEVSAYSGYRAAHAAQAERITQLEHEIWCAGVNADGAREKSAERIAELDRLNTQLHELVHSTHGIALSVSNDEVFIDGFGAMPIGGAARIAELESALLGRQQEIGRLMTRVGELEAQAAPVSAPATVDRDAIEEIRALLDGAYRFQSTSPKAQANINAALDLLDSLKAKAAPAMPAQGQAQSVAGTVEAAHHWNRSMIGVKALLSCADGELECIGEKLLDQYIAEVNAVYAAMSAYCAAPVAQPAAPGEALK